MKDPVVLITGALTGIGRATICELRPSCEATKQESKSGLPMFGEMFGE
jgi:hypothetical protein